MRRFTIAIVLVALGWLATAGVGRAARTTEGERLPPGDVIELVVFEIDGCNYCELFRRDVLPAYLMTPRAHDVPKRFIDLNEVGRGLKLESPIEIVPTVVLVRNNREAGRITGYSGPENFFHLVRYLFSRAE